MGSQILSVLLGWYESVGRAEPLQASTFSSQSELSFKRQPILADEVQTFKALITVHKVLQEGHPVAVKEAQSNVHWLESLMRGLTGDGLRGWASPFYLSIDGSSQSMYPRDLRCDEGYGPLIRDYVYFLLAKLAFHRQHPEFNGILSPRLPMDPG